jgi:hypothetical protein
MTYPARCPTCSSIVMDTLASARDVPIYACGYYGNSHAAVVRVVEDAPDLVLLTPGESRELLDLVDFTELALLRSAHTRALG